MKCSLLKTIFILLVPLLQSSAFVSNAPAEGETFVLDPIVVTAEGKDETFQTGDVDLKQTTTFYSVITRDQFESKIETVAEVIEKEAGLQVRRSGGLGSFSTVSLRGSSSEQVMVYLDGILLNDASGGGVDLSNIALADVESIEVYRGITPVNFGKASIGGVVNIKTLRSKEGLRASLLGGYGSFDTKKYAGYINHKPGRWDYIISADTLKSDNDFRFDHDNRTPLNPDDDRRENRNNAQFDQENLLTRVGYDFTDLVRIDLSNQWFKKDQHLPNLHNSPEANTTFDTKRNSSFAKLTLNDLGRFHVNMSNQWYYTWKEEEYDDSDGFISLNSPHNRNLTRKYGTHVFLEWPTDHHIVSAVSEAYQESYSPRDLKKVHDPAGAERDYLSFAIQDSMLLLNDGLIITPGLRTFYYHDEHDSNNVVTNDGKDLSDTYTRPQLGIQYRPLTWLAFKANAAQYVREPSFFELFGDRGFLLPNPNLEPEKGNNYDFGFEIDWRSDVSCIERVSGTIAYFIARIDDLIARSYDARGIGQSQNIAEASIDGLEASIAIDILKFFRLAGNYTWQDTEISKYPKPFYEGNHLPGRFERSLFTRIEAAYGPAKVYGEYVVEKDMYFDSANTIPADTKREINVGCSWQVRSFLIFLEGKNITDNAYQDFNGYPLPGRAYYLTLKYEFS